MCSVSESSSETCGSKSSSFANPRPPKLPRSPQHMVPALIPHLVSKKMLAVAMAPMAAYVFSPALHPCSHSYSCPRRRCHGALKVAASASSSSPEETKDVVIVGAGIAGLATALSLRRLGVGATVLEQGPSLRAGGTSLTLFKNGWRVLDSIGVADELRAKYLRVQG
uniref:Uncharacterized protein n=1 Tax=Avena sativa TaxID=4498 RepID=A0ACD5ULI0_AVESA